MKTKTKIRILFIIRICLWITALISTGYWVYFSFKLTYVDEIFDPYEYASLLRPVLYPCLIIALAAIGISFALYAQSKKLKAVLKREMSTADTEEPAETV